MTNATIIPTAEIRAGDKLLAVEGHSLSQPIVVRSVVDASADTVHIRVNAADSSLVTPDRYLLYRHVTVERAECPRRATRRTFEGITFIRQQDGSWLTEDGEWEVSYQDDFETECLEPHPMKISAETRRRFSMASDWEREHRWGPWELVWALREGRRGYLCPGGEIHYYGLWVAGSAGSSDVVNREETFTASAHHLARFIKGEVGSHA